RKKFSRKFVSRATTRDELLAELGDPVRQPRNLPACGVLMHLAGACSLHELRLGFLHCLERLVTVAGCDCFFNLADGRAHARAASLVDRGAAGDLTRGFTGG